MPKVSVIIATYERPRVLKLALRSLLDQDHENWEGLVIGDACGEETARVVAGFGDSRLRYDNLAENCGEQSGPNNRGLALAAGRTARSGRRDRVSHSGMFTRLFASLGIVALFAGSAAAGQVGFAYALQQVDGGPNQIYGFRFDQSTGALTLLSGFPVASGGIGTDVTASEQLAYHDGRLYVINDGDDTMTAFSVNRSTGALAAMPFSPVELGFGDWRCVAVHPGGSPVVVGNGDDGSLASFVVSDNAATAAPGSPFAIGDPIPFSCRFSQSGQFVYTGGNLGDRIAGFSVNTGNGVLTALAGSPFNTDGARPGAYATDRNGRLFTASESAPELRAFRTLSGGALGAVAGNPFASGLTTASHGLLHPGGFYMVADRAGNRVGSYRITGTGAGTTLTAVGGSPFAAGGTFTNALALAPDGAHLLAANGTSRNLTVFQVNAGTGVLTSIGVQAANTLGASGITTGLAFAPGEAGFVYAFQQVVSGSNQIHGFRINPSTGALSLLPGFPVATGGTGSSDINLIASEQIAYVNGRLYVVNYASGTLTAYKVNRTTGALTPLPFSPLTLGGPFGWMCVAVHPSGSPVVAAKANFFASFNVGATTATQAAGSPFNMGSGGVYSCEFSRDGNYVYAGPSTGATFAGSSVNAGSGVLTTLAGSPFNSGGGSPIGLATDSSGRLFITNAGDSEVRAFTTSSGVPTGVSGNPFISGLGIAAHGVRHQAGFYMVADRDGNRVGVYQVGGSGAATTLTAVSGSPFASAGTWTHALAVTEDGGFLVAANAVSRNLTMFQVNPATGVLTSLGAQPADTLGATGTVGGVVFVPVVPPFIDDPLTATASVIKAVHIAELRTRIDAVRAQHGLGPYPYSDPTLTALTMVRAVHVSDLRAALAEVYTAVGMAGPSYTDPTLTIGTTVVKVAHIAELRAAVVAIE